MKKLILSSIAILMASSLAAQIRFGAKAGVNMAKVNMSYTDPNQNRAESSVTSYHLGAYVEFKALPKLFIQPGLELQGLGGQLDESPNETKINSMYLRVPVHLVTRLNLGLGGIFAGVGPYYGYALSGKSETAGVSEDLNFGNSTNDEFRRSDWGLSAMAGYQFMGGLNLAVGYQTSLGNVLPKDLDALAKAKNQNFSISLGYSIKL